jgi:hypothetical protein
MTKAAVIKKLEIAKTAMQKAARAMQDTYGKDYRNAVEMLGAAGMVTEWIHAIEIEETIG